MEYSINDLFAGRYRLLRKCGKGSFGQVWLARDEQIDMEVAVKIYIALDSRGIEDFKSEFKSAYELNHPSLLHATYFDVYQDRPYLVMPFCPSSSLSLIGQIDEEQLWKFIHDVSSGLAYLHEHNVIHRDIKPDNILMDGNGGFLISDFGISTKIRSTLRRNSTREHNSNSSGGSLPYMGPELFSGHPEPVKATDIWAFGATLHELITGELPFMGHGGVMQLNGAAVPELDGVDPIIASLVQACMSKDPWDRPTAARISEYAEARLRGESPRCPWAQHTGGRRKSRPKEKRSRESEGYGKRHWFVVFWIWFMIAVNAAVAVWAAVNVIPNVSSGFASALSRLVVSVLLFYVFGALQLWLKNLWGFRLLLIAAAFNLLLSILMVDIYGVLLMMDINRVLYTVGQVVGIIISILILYGILQIRKNGQSAWKQLELRWNKSELRISLPVAVVLLAVVWLIPNSTVREAKAGYGNYKSLTESCSDLINEGSQSDPQPLIQARAILKDMRILENEYSRVDSRYDDVDRLEARLQEKVKPVAASWAAAAAAQSRIGNMDKALEFYATSINLYEDAEVREKFEKLAAKYGFIKPLGLDLAGDGQEYGRVRKDGLKYIYPRLKYEPMDVVESHEVEFIVKFYEDGRLSVGEIPGCSYKKEYTVKPDGDGYLYLDGYGNTSGTSYSDVSTVRVEVWCGNKKLITETQTLE